MIEYNQPIKISGINELTTKQLNLVNFCYAKIISSSAVSFYLLLLALNQHKDSYSYEFFNQFINSDLDQCRIQCEEVMLIRTFQETTGYHIVCYEPKEIDEFISHPILGRLFYQSCPESTASYILNFFNYPQPKLLGKEISAVINLKALSIDDTSEFEYNQLLNLKNNNRFDINDFLNDTSSLLFPYSLRTKRNTELIEQMAQHVAITYDQLRKIIYSAIDAKGNLFNESKFKYNFEQFVNHNQVSEIGQQGDALSYLQSLQQVPLTKSSVDMIKKLKQNYHYDDRTIITILKNLYMIDPFKINSGYIEKLCESFSRAQLHSESQIEQYFKTLNQKHKQSKPIISEVQYSLSSDLASDDLIDEVTKLINGK